VGKRKKEREREYWKFRKYIDSRINLKSKYNLVICIYSFVDLLAYEFLFSEENVTVQHVAL
jgi:hypothetical protein